MFLTIGKVTLDSNHVVSVKWNDRDNVLISASLELSSGSRVTAQTPDELDAVIQLYGNPLSLKRK